MRHSTTDEVARDDLYFRKSTDVINKSAVNQWANMEQNRSRAGRLWWGVGYPAGPRHPRAQDRRIPTLQRVRDFPKLVPKHVLLLLPGVPGEGPGQPPDHPDRLLPPPPEGLHHHRLQAILQQWTLQGVFFDWPLQYFSEGLKLSDSYN